MNTQARASIFTELKAPKGFATIYQGKDCTVPVALTYQLDGLDEKAGEMRSALASALAQSGNVYPIQSNFGSGISPFLVGGLPVPIYSTVDIHIPAIGLVIPEYGFDTYNYRLIWRIRSFQTSQVAGSARAKPFHAPNTSPGPNYDGTGQLSGVAGAAWQGKCEERFQVYAAYNGLAYAQAEPTEDASFQNVYPNFTKVIRINNPDNNESPIFAGFTPGQVAKGDIVQGFSDTPSFEVKHVCFPERALGDELVVLVSRTPRNEASSTWNFTGTDATFLEHYSRDLTRDRSKSYGILIATGVAP